MKKNLKKFLGGMLAAAMILSLAACSSEDDTLVDTIVVPDSDEETVSADGDYVQDVAWPDSISLGDAFPDFTVTLSDGSEFRLTDALKTHKAVLINIWGTWCGPCRNEFPYMNEAYNEYSDDIAVVCLSNTDTLEDIISFKEENELDLPMGQDTVGIADLVVSEGYPTNIIVDRFGNYVFYECGSVEGTDAFERMFETFIGDDYTESTVITEIPGPKPNVSAISDEELTKAFCPDGSLGFTTPTDDAYCWPFLTNEEGVINSNAGVNSTYAEMDTTLEAKAGDVFAFDYDIDSEAASDGLLVTVNGTEVRFITGTETDTFVYEFPEDGSFEISLSFTTDGYSQEATDYIVLKNATLATGDAAAELLANVKTFPQTLEGNDLTMEFTNAKEILFDGDNNTIADSFGSDARFFVADGSGFANVRICIGADADPYYGLSYGDCDYTMHLLHQCDTDGNGFIYTAPLSSVEDGGYSNTYFYAMTDFNEGDYIMYVVFANEQNANYFVTSEITGTDGNPMEGVTWQYADGTAPSTDEVAVEAAFDGTATYTVYIVDENGNPVDGCTVNVCTDESCSPSVAEGGELTFTNTAYPYVIHILKYPDGYTFDTSEEFVMPEEGGEITITVNKAQ